MSGLIYRDLILYWRKYSKLTHLMEVGYFFLFLFCFNNKYAVYTFFLLVLPISMSGLPATLKELDTNYKGMRSVRLLPYSRQDIVTARFLSAFSCHIFYLAEMALFAVCHHVLRGGISLRAYPLLIAGGWMIAIFMTSINLLTSFISGLNATAIFYMLSTLVILGAYLFFIFTDIQIDFLAELFSLSVTARLLCGVIFNTVVLALCYLIAVKRFKKTA